MSLLFSEFFDNLFLLIRRTHKHVFSRNFLVCYVSNILTLLSMLKFNKRILYIFFTLFKGEIRMNTKFTINDELSTEELLNITGGIMLPFNQFGIKLTPENATGVLN